MKVYVVGLAYEHNLAVFSSREKAEACVQRQCAIWAFRHPKARPMDRHYFDIEEFELDVVPIEFDDGTVL